MGLLLWPPDPRDDVPEPQLPPLSPTAKPIGPRLAKAPKLGRAPIQGKATKAAAGGTPGVGTAFAKLSSIKKSSHSSSSDSSSSCGGSSSSDSSDDDPTDNEATKNKGSHQALRDHTEAASVPVKDQRAKVQAAVFSTTVLGSKPEAHGLKRPLAAATSAAASDSCSFGGLQKSDQSQRHQQQQHQEEKDKENVKPAPKRLKLDSVTAPVFTAAGAAAALGAAAAVGAAAAGTAAAAAAGAGAAAAVATKHGAPPGPAANTPLQQPARVQPAGGARRPRMPQDAHGQAVSVADAEGATVLGTTGAGNAGTENGKGVKQKQREQAGPASKAQLSMTSQALPKVAAPATEGSATQAPSGSKETVGPGEGLPVPATGMPKTAAPATKGSASNTNETMGALGGVPVPAGAAAAAAQELTAAAAAAAAPGATAAVVSFTKRILPIAKFILVPAAVLSNVLLGHQQLPQQEQQLHQQQQEQQQQQQQQQQEAMKDMKQILLVVVKDGVQVEGRLLVNVEELGASSRGAVPAGNNRLQYR